VPQVFCLLQTLAAFCITQAEMTKLVTHGPGLVKSLCVQLRRL
jgi:hypothetical protein